jgi:hypothetical protein
LVLLSLLLLLLLLLLLVSSFPHCTLSNGNVALSKSLNITLSLLLQLL